MGLFSRLGAAYRGLMAAEDGGRYDPNDARWWRAAGMVAMVGGVAVTRQAALGHGATQAVLGGLERAVKTLPRAVFRREPDGRRVQVDDHPLARLLRESPNDWQTPAEFLGELARDAAFDREFMAEIVTDGDGNPVALWRMPPDQTVVEWSEGRRFYTYTPRGQKARVRLRDDVVLHLTFGPLTDDQARAVPLWQGAARVFGRSLAVETYGERFFANSGRSGNYITVPPTAFKDKEKQNEFLESWRANSTGDNAHRDKLLLSGMDVKPGDAPKNNEAQFLETIGAGDAAIFGLFGFPPHMAARLDRATFSNIEHQAIQFVQHCLMPLLVVVEQGLARALLPKGERGSHYVKFRVDGLLRGDAKSRWEAHMRGFQSGALSPNDIRELEDLERRPGLDRHFMPANGVMIDPTTGAVEAPPAPARDAAPADPPPEPATQPTD